MEVHYNLAASLVGSLFGILILFCVLINSHLIRDFKSSRSARWMAALIGICLIGCISELTFELVNGQIFSFSRELNIIAKTINHLESICAGFIFVGLMRALMFPDEKKWPGHLRVITTLTCTFGAVLLVVNLFTGVAFSVNMDNIYSRGPLGQLGLIISFVTLIYSAILLAIDNRNSTTYLRYPVMLYILPFLVGGGLQATIPSMRLAGVSFALGVVTMHLSIQRRLLYTDAMTGVFNRTYMEYFFKEAVKKEQKATFAGLLIDINSFKVINDTLGHGAGDDAIRNAGKILKDTSEPEYLVMRYGGDEFVLVKKYGSLSEVKAQKEKIKAAVEEFNENNDLPYELSFSIGITECEIAKEGFDLFLETMDKSLYQDKKDYYEKTGKERRR